MERTPQPPSGPAPSGDPHDPNAPAEWPPTVGGPSQPPAWPELIDQGSQAQLPSIHDRAYAAALQCQMETCDPQWMSVLAQFLEEQEIAYRCSAQDCPWRMDDIALERRGNLQWNQDKSQSAPQELMERQEINHDMDLWAFDWRAHWRQVRKHK